MSQSSPLRLQRALGRPGGGQRYGTGLATATARIGARRTERVRWRRVSPLRMRPTALADAIRGTTVDQSTRQRWARMAASSGLGFGVAAALMSLSVSPVGALLAAVAGLACAWSMARRAAPRSQQLADIDRWSTADDDPLLAPPRLTNEESLWARLAESAGAATPSRH